MKIEAALVSGHSSPTLSRRRVFFSLLPVPAARLAMPCLGQLRLACCSCLCFHTSGLSFVTGGCHWSSTPPSQDLPPQLAACKLSIVIRRGKQASTLNPSIRFGMSCSAPRSRSLRCVLLLSSSMIRFRCGWKKRARRRRAGPPPGASSPGSGRPLFSRCLIGSAQRALALFTTIPEWTGYAAAVLTPFGRLHYSDLPGISLATGWVTAILAQ